MEAIGRPDETPLDANSAGTKPVLRVVIAYHDLAAGRRALHAMANLAKSLRADVDYRPFPWRFDLLAEVDWRAVATSEAVTADMLIIATNDSGPLPPAVCQWAVAAISRKQGTVAAVVALFGPEGNPDGTDSSRLETIQTAARRAGLDFFAPAPHHQHMEAGGVWVGDRVRDRICGEEPAARQKSHREERLDHVQASE